MKGDGRDRVKHSHYLVLMEDRWWFNLGRRPPFKLPKFTYSGYYVQGVVTKASETVPLAVDKSIPVEEVKQLFGSVTLPDGRSVPVIKDSAISMLWYLNKADRAEEKPNE